MKILRIGLLVVVVLLALFFAIGAFLPSQWNVVHSATLQAKPEQVYGLVANLKLWQTWSPWTKDKDPTMEFTYTGAEEGVGAQWNWTSENMGTGWLKIVQADPQSGIKYELFIDMKGSQSTVTGQIAFEAQEDFTLVTWTDSGDVGNDISRKWMALLMKMMIKREMTAGLEKLNQVLSVQAKS